MSDAAAEPPPDAWRENVAAIVMDASGRVLLGLDGGRKAHWHFPQGGVGSDETLEEALCRELWEEVRLAPESYRIVASIGGFRYAYRKRNEKCRRWRGQQQTYFLLQCHGDTPPTDCGVAGEFAELTWQPWQELDPSLFVPFKRGVVEQVLARFFPPTEADPAARAARELTAQRYRRANLPASPPDALPLFAGGKEEAQLHLARLALRLRAAQKRMAARGERLLVLIHGSEGSGRKQCLRRLAAALDPLALRCGVADAFAEPLPQGLLALLPAAGTLTLALHEPAAPADVRVWSDLEQWLAGQGVRLLKLYLAADENDLSPADAALLAATDTPAAPWYVLPSGKRWYRDLLAADLLAEAMEGR